MNETVDPQKTVPQSPVSVRAPGLAAASILLGVMGLILNALLLTSIHGAPTLIAGMIGSALAIIGPLISRQRHSWTALSLFIAFLALLPVAGTIAIAVLLGIGFSGVR
ncbi:hypothetical protein FHU41_001182 [Psychromicrobium silvestre]|uniref:Uncharacterized protein n=1 Tax=Psychromicrobium silvestre TaxID=1645614 RepID=A0A7Y9LSU5_9MICC|nr:hypothetical protein [Psychromicrobium silvestre]NYE94961.1 hypothetical protein [Psychromicrobium silvestre]